MNASEGKRGFLTFLVLAFTLSSVFLIVQFIKRNWSLVFSTPAVEVPTPANIRVENITTNSADILWETKKPNMGYVIYGITSIICEDFSSNTCLKVLEQSKNTSHSVKLTGLIPNTTYYIKIGIGSALFPKENPIMFTTLKESSASKKDNLPKNLLSKVDTHNLTKEGFNKALEKFDSTYDLNKDGVINSLDYILLNNSR